MTINLLGGGPEWPAPVLTLVQKPIASEPEVDSDPVGSLREPVETVGMPTVAIKPTLPHTTTSDTFPFIPSVPPRICSWSATDGSSPSATVAADPEQHDELRT